MQECFIRMKRKKIFGYNSTVICEESNYILTVDVNPSNMHDSMAFYTAFEKFSDKYDLGEVEYFVGDAAYITLHICKTIIDLDMTPALPHKRPMTKKEYFNNNLF